MEEQLKQQFDLLNSFVLQFEEEVLQRFFFENRIEEINAIKNKIETETRLIIYNENVDGKKVYTNEKTRSDALTKVLESNADYQKQLEEYNAINKKLFQTKAQIEILSVRLSVMKKQADLLIELSRNKNK